MIVRSEEKWTADDPRVPWKNILFLLGHCLAVGFGTGLFDADPEPEHPEWILSVS